MKYTEEEKEAIEVVSNLRCYYNDESLLNEDELKENKINNNSIDLVLKLLDKQQKEIEELKRINKDYDLIYNKQYEYIQDCISKKVIREKIEELKDKEQEFTDEQGYWGDSSIQHKIEILTELLDE